MNWYTLLTGTLLTMAAACSSSEPESVPEPVAQVTTAIVKRGDLPEIVTGFGIIEFDPAGLHTLNAEIEALVLGVDALPGVSVRQGDVVLRLGPSMAAGTELARTVRDAATAEAVAARAQRLRADGLASDADVEAAVSVAKDQTALADSLAARAGSVRELRTPIAGVLDALLVEPGDLVAPGTMMARIASPEAIQARIGIEIEDAARLASGDKVSLTPLAGRRSPFDAVIRVIDSRVNPATRMAAALVSIPPGQNVHSGEAIRARIVVATKRDVLMAPRQSVFTDEAGDFVFVDREGVAILKRIEAGLTSGDQTEIRSGIDDGDRLIVAGAAILSDGMKIRVVSSPLAGDSKR